MINSSATSTSLDELAAIAIRLGRELSALAHSVHLCGNGRDFVFVVRTLRRLTDRDPFDNRDDAALESVRSILDTALRSEIVAYEPRLIETHYDNDGQHGEIRECAIYSDRGQDLLRVGEVLTRFVAARQAALDRIAAERAVNRLLRA